MATFNGLKKIGIWSTTLLRHYSWMEKLAMASTPSHLLNSYASCIKVCCPSVLPRELNQNMNMTKNVVTALIRKDGSLVNWIEAEWTPGATVGGEVEGDESAAGVGSCGAGAGTLIRKDGSLVNWIWAEWTPGTVVEGDVEGDGCQQPELVLVDQGQDQEWELDWVP